MYWESGLGSDEGTEIGATRDNRCNGHGVVCVPTPCQASLGPGLAGGKMVARFSANVSGDLSDTQDNRAEG